MKPENLMMFNGRLKVIDVHGCVKMNTKIDTVDDSISFTPCYCAPEWARFLIGDNKETILALPGLDVWSVGITLCELITRDPVMVSQCGNFLRMSDSDMEAGVLFMEWLGGMHMAPVPSKVGKHDKAFLDLLNNWLLPCKEGERKTCAQCLSHEFIANEQWEVEKEMWIANNRSLAYFSPKENWDDPTSNKDKDTMLPLGTKQRKPSMLSL